MTTFLALTEELASAGSLAAKKKLSKKASQFLAEDRELSETLIYPMVVSALTTLPAFQSVFDSNQFKVRLGLYKDSDSLTKVAVGVAFLQNHEKVDHDLDTMVMNELLERFRSAQLDLVVNDFTVNTLQVRNFEMGSML